MVGRLSQAIGAVLRHAGAALHQIRTAPAVRERAVAGLAFAAIFAVGMLCLDAVITGGAPDWRPSAMITPTPARAQNLEPRLQQFELLDPPAIVVAAPAQDLAEADGELEDLLGGPETTPVAAAFPPPLSQADTGGDEPSALMSPKPIAFIVAPVGAAPGKLKAPAAL